MLILATALALSACTLGPPQPQLAVEDDKFLPYRQYSTGRNVLIDIGTTRATELIARRDRTTGTLTTLVDIELGYSSDHLAGFSQARNAHSTLLPFKSIFRHRRCKKGECDFQERFTVTIPEQDLRAAGPQGYAFKVFAPTGAASTIIIEKAHIDQLLAATSRAS